MENWKTELETRKIAYDCRDYLGDRPCVWHKKQGVLCECDHYIPLNGSLLIIKLDAMGDVLRTTCLLPVIDRAWPGARITWLTKPESVPLLENDSYVSEIIPYGVDSVVQLSTRTFDKVINLDAGKISSGMASMAKAPEKIGYLLHEQGYVYATNKAAEKWLRLGLFDDLKKANKRTYQEWMVDILGLPGDGMRYVLELTDKEKETGRKSLEQKGVDFSKAIIGIHTGAGARWPQKQWGADRVTALIDEFTKGGHGKYQVVLFGGPSEKEMNQRIMAEVGKSVFDGGCNHTIRHFAAMLGCCSVVLSGDSLAMHIALAMGRRVVVLFGPTSPAEIELYDLGEKVVPAMDCVSCYKKECDYQPNCMASISVNLVKNAIYRQLELATNRA